MTARTTAGNLLREPLIGVSDAHGQRCRLTLPQVFARLSDPQASTIAFTAAQAHQGHAVHAFLVQVAAMALRRAGLETPPTDPAWWQTYLLAVSDGCEAAWTLVVTDLKQPAFLQPPVPEGALAAFANHLGSPGAVDLLVTAKNHDRKLESGATDDPQAWMLALITMQTGQGYSGKANYGVFRMNGGLGNRPGVGLRDSQDLGAAFRRDVGVLLRQREQVCDDAGFGSAGTALLWCLPWDGKRSAVFATLDPWVVECCRRIRLIDEGGITARMAPTQAARVATSDAFTGNAGDPWTPINAKTNKSLTLPKDGFTYKRVADLLLNGDWAAPAAQIPQPGDGPDLRWYGRALVRGQGKTEGWHEREVPIDRRIGKRFAQRDEREALGKRAQEMITNAGVMRLGILKPALVTLWHEAEGRVEPALRRLEQRIDHEFFPVLWNTDADLTAWRTALKTWAQAILDAEISTVAETASRWRRISEATSRFEYGLHRKTHKDIKAMFLPLTTVSTP